MQPHLLPGALSTLRNRRRGDRLAIVSMTRIAIAAAILCVSAAATVAAANNDDAVRRSTAVTLNYCRASFHRIQKLPTLRVLIEEQEKILNNLDLNGIADQEVVKLYTGVLVEISEVRLSDRERHMVQEKFHTALSNSLTANAFDLSTQLASAQYLAAVRTGVRSWWDYRNISTVREVDVMRVDRQRLMALTDKSALFLDTFWKLARDRKIPDRWLIRSQDLGRLDAAMQESNLSVRLRVLKRMEEFMTCYPPYWYYVARTQQGLGQLPEAAATFDRLLQIGHGHFRKDDMLAAGLANRAVILDYLHQPGAAEAALKALSYSTDVWEANLMCAQVLGRSGRATEAEDAVLRNLDVDLEREQSIVALISLYTRTGNAAKLADRLTNATIVRRVPVPLLLRAAAVLGPNKLPEAVCAHLALSVAAHYELSFGPDDFVLVTIPAWNLQFSEMSLSVADESHRQSTIALAAGKSEVRFAKIGEFGRPLPGTASPSPAVLIVKFPETPLVRLKLENPTESSGNTTQASFPGADMFASATLPGRRLGLRLVSIDIGEKVFPILSRSGAGGTAPGAEIDDSPPATVPPPTDPAATGSSFKIPAPPPASQGIDGPQLFP